MNPVCWSATRQVRKVCGPTKVDNKLDDLHDGNVLFPPDSNASCALKIVEIHYDVDCQVEDNGHPRDRRITS